MQPTGTVLLAAKRRSLARVPMPAQDSRRAHGLLYLTPVRDGWLQQEHRHVRLDVGLSAWELACHALPTTVFAAQRLFTLSVSGRCRPSQTAPSGTQGARPADDHDRRNTVTRRLTGNQLGRSVMADLMRRAGVYVHVTDGW